jgi:hypothetical protein
MGVPEVLYHLKMDTENVARVIKVKIRPSSSVPFPRMLLFAVLNLSLANP